MAEPCVGLIGSLDTKGAEYVFVKNQLAALGCKTIVLDYGILGDPSFEPDFSHHDLAAKAGSSIQALRGLHERSIAMEIIASGCRLIVKQLHEERRIHGVMVLGGSNAAYIMSTLADVLDIGVPKVLVSTSAAGDTRPYVDGKDITLINPIVDVGGLNQISRLVFANAAAAMAGMVAQVVRRNEPKYSDHLSPPQVAVTMSGLTTQCGTLLREHLEDFGFEVLVFHANGAGGAAMEAFAGANRLAGVADVTTTELADELVGGFRSAGPTRLTTAGAKGIPEVVSLGGLDVVNFGPPESVPERFSGRLLHSHNPSVTLMRTNENESRELGRRIAARLNAARGPVSVIIPEGGLSQISVRGGVFDNQEADTSLFEELTAALSPSIPVSRLTVDINHPSFAAAVAKELRQLLALPHRA